MEFLKLLRAFAFFFDKNKSDDNSTMIKIR